MTKTTAERIADSLIAGLRPSSGVPVAFQTPDQPQYLVRFRYERECPLAAHEAMDAVQAFASKLGLHVEAAKIMTPRDSRKNNGKD